jgi:hypothetical protein
MHEYRLADVDRSAAARKKTNNALRVNPLTNPALSISDSVFFLPLCPHFPIPSFSKGLLVIKFTKEIQPRKSFLK